jgi:hypothetical protein
MRIGTLKNSLSPLEEKRDNLINKILNEHII